MIYRLRPLLSAGELEPPELPGRRAQNVTHAHKLNTHSERLNKQRRERAHSVWHLHSDERGQNDSSRGDGGGGSQRTNRSHNKLIFISTKCTGGGGRPPVVGHRKASPVRLLSNDGGAGGNPVHQFASVQMAESCVIRKDQHTHTHTGSRDGGIKSNKPINSHRDECAAMLSEYVRKCLLFSVARACAFVRALIDVAVFEYCRAVFRGIWFPSVSIAT